MSEKLEMKSMDVSKRNLEIIKRFFPNAVTEAIKDGKTELVVDFDALKQELSPVLLEEKQERYQMTWPDKGKSKALANTQISATLRPIKEKSVDFDRTKNLYIEGDNLDVLKLLQETYLGKIKMIYIDPPYNTGNDFVYEDDFAQSSEEYIENSGQYDNQGNKLFLNTESNGRFHTDWLNMIYPRLKIAKDLLKENGAIFISVDDNEAGNLLKVCDEIFGASNFVAQIPWQSRQSIQNDTDISVNHEYVVIYAKNRRQENRRLKENNIQSWFNQESFAFLPIPLDRDKFENPDNDPRGIWKADPMDAPNVRANLTYPITNPTTGETFYPPVGRHWRFSQEKFEEALKDNRIVWGKNGTGRPQMKVFYEEKKLFGSIDNSWWSAERFGTATQGTKELIDLFGGQTPFDTPKPVKLIYNILKLVSQPENNDLILDFFSGSATTAHAVMKLNADDGGHRKFILVQLDEKCREGSLAEKSGYSTICDIGEDRIRRAGERIKKENGLTAQNLDTGFRVLKLDSSNMQDVYYNPHALQQTLLDQTIDNIKADRSPLDLLFQIMLELGVELSANIEEKTIHDKTVLTVNGNDIIACFDDDITNNVIVEIAKQQPIYAVFKDKSFATDSVGINNEQLFKTYSPATIIKVL